MTRSSWVAWLSLFLVSCAGGPADPPAPEPDLFTTGSQAEHELADRLAHEWLASNARTRARGTWQTRRVVVDDLQTAHVRVTQHHQGVEVFGAQLIVHLNRDGSVRDVSDGSLADLAVDTTPLYTPDEAVDLAVFEEGDWERVSHEPTVKLVILRHEERDHLTWQVDVPMLDGTNESSAPRVFVDAHDGSIVWSYDNLQDFEPGTATTAYNGAIDLQVTFNNGFGVYTLLGEHHATYDFLNTTNQLFFVASLSTDFSAEPEAADAHFGVHQTLIYFDAEHGRQGPDDAFGPELLESSISSGVHYGTQVNNAFWNSSPPLMIFGDGDGVVFDPLTSLDISAHELTHAITEYSGGLIYNGESGALNESMSDVFAAAVEAMVEGSGSPNIWLIGEDSYTPGIPGDALRYMDDPEADGFSRDHFRTRYIGPLDNGGVHWNSGIANLAFKLLVDGGSHPNPGKSVGTVTPLGFQDATAIWYRALDLYMTPRTTFHQARFTTLAAAADLFGAGSPEHVAVGAAWAEVGILPPTTTHSPVAGALNSWTYYNVNVPADATLRVTTYGGTGDADLYIRRGNNNPTPSQNVCASFNVGNDEECVVTNGQPTSNYRIGINAFTAYSGLTVEIRLVLPCDVSATEIANNGVDENCDQLDAACGPLGGPGCTMDLTITEIMANPRDASAAREYIEIRNNAPHAVDLRGGRLRRTGSNPQNLNFNSFTVIPAGARYVIAGSIDPASNGGIKHVKRTLGNVVLGNTSGSLQLRDSQNASGFLIFDEVVYDATFSSGNQVPRGASLQLDPDFTNSAENDVPTRWCDARRHYGLGDFGSPGQPNDDCDWTLDIGFAYDTNADGNNDGNEDDILGETTVDFWFDDAERWFTTGNLGEGGGLDTPLNLQRWTDTSGQHISFTYDVTGVTYTGTRPFGQNCWPGGTMSNLPAWAYSGSWTHEGCTED